jgi:hypothetical protein
MAGVLTFSQYIGGPDEIISEQSFPSSQSSVIYNFNRNISGWTFSADYQTLVVNPLKFNRYTGQPNFSDSLVLGYFPLVDIATDDPLSPSIINAEQGTVLVTFPANMYAGAIIPDARQNVPIVVFSFTWNTGSTPRQTSSNRWAIIQAWEPDVALGDPIAEANFTELTL